MTLIVIIIKPSKPLNILAHLKFSIGQNSDHYLKYGCVILQEYDIRRGHFKNIEGDKLKELMESTFGKVEVDDSKLTIKFGALQPLIAWLKDKNVLCVDTTMNKDVSENEINDTIRKYNQFLEAATGFNAKERVKRAKKKAEK